MKQVAVLLFFLFVHICSFAKLDDSILLSNDSTFDEGQYIAGKISESLTLGKLDSAKAWLDIESDCVKVSNDHHRIFDFYSNLCAYYEYLGAIDTAEYYCEKAIDVAEEAYELQLISSGHTNLATVYTAQGKTATALNLLKIAYEIDKQREDKVDLAYTLNNIGYIYLQHKEYVQAFEVFEDILKLEIDSTNVYLDRIKGTALLNIADIHLVFKEYDELSKVLTRINDLKLFTKNNDFESYVLFSILKGQLAMSQGDYSLARKIFLITVKEANKKDLPLPKLNSYLAIGDYYLKRKQFNKAYEVFERAYKITKSNKLLDFEYDVSLKLAETLKSLNKDQAIYFYEKSIILSDSLFDIQKSEAVADMQAFHEVEDQKDENDVLREIELKSSNRLDAQQKFIYFTIIIVLILLVFLYYIYLNQRKTKKLNFKLTSALDKIEMANIEIENVNEELLKKNDILKETLEHSEAQGKQLNYQNQKISNSIKSALLIQSSILPSQQVIDHAFPNNFIFNQPKDIVSGDFYWFTEQDDWKIYACIDCTGHGVPGALMSMMGASSLYEIVRGKRIFSPSEILKELNNIVVRNLQQEKTMNNDGMDMSIIAVNGNQLYCAGAKNPIYLVRDNEIHKLKATRKSIGGELNLSYEEHHWEIQAGDCLYMATDGYQDQFGGPNAKKFLVKKFRETLLEVSSKTVEEQKRELGITINNWRSIGNWEQVDDMLIVGIKF
ncbi:MULTISPECIES: SpoIIE family protein phosphatase [unclassified Flammeovirga]|uniref:SpoIIE family protein phosphatase n=1 Tax=unclassified Flammeovirga TaxID=2637820 RepID=UPI00155DB135|nr:MULTISPECIES: SpoIIE family protein phosphatase [unclassified Flammeovirga]